MTKSLFAPLAALLIGLLALPAEADIYKCRLANGKTEISNAPCPSGSGTVTARPDDTVSAQNREQAERDVERMHNYVEKREAVQRADENTERARQAGERQAIAQQRVYDSASMDDCLRELAQQGIDGKRRAELEAICRAKPKNEPSVVTVPVPVYGNNGGLGNGIGLCIQSVMRLNLPAAEQSRRVAQCQGNYSQPPVATPLPSPAEPRPETRPGKPCPRGDKYCVR